MSVISISAAVGLNAANRYQDVINVQVMLNHFIGNRKLLGYQPLSLDGKCGPKTREAIMAFQLQNGLVSGEHFQAQVKPGGPTISHMNKNAGHVPGIPGGSASAPARPPSDAEAVAAAMARIKEVYNLTAAEEAQSHRRRGSAVEDHSDLRLQERICRSVQCNGCDRDCIEHSQVG